MWLAHEAACARPTMHPPSLARLRLIVFMFYMRESNLQTAHPSNSLASQQWTHKNIHTRAQTCSNNSNQKRRQTIRVFCVYVCMNMCTLYFVQRECLTGVQIPWTPHIYICIYIYTHITHIYIHTTHIQTLTKQHTRQDIQTTHDTLLKHTTPCRRSMLAGVQIAYTPHTYIYININTHHPRVYIYICKHTHNIQTLTQHTHNIHTTHIFNTQHTQHINRIQHTQQSLSLSLSLYIYISLSLSLSLSHTHTLSLSLSLSLNLFL